jgi:hypothetical protein
LQSGDLTHIAKIETTWNDTSSVIPTLYKRTFDFNNLTVVDEVISDRDNIALILVDSASIAEHGTYEQYFDYVKTYYNTPIQVATFSAKQSNAFLTRANKYGLFYWSGLEVPEGIVTDGANKRITIYFEDGSDTSTLIYTTYPKYYDEVVQTFSDELCVEMYNVAK